MEQSRGSRREGEHCLQDLALAYLENLHKLWAQRKFGWMRGQGVSFVALAWTHLDNSYKMWAPRDFCRMLGQWVPPGAHHQGEFCLASQWVDYAVGHAQENMECFDCSESTAPGR